MPHHVCPWWIGYWLSSPLRKLWQDPRKILSPLVSEGMTVLEPGPGMGFFTLELARLVGSSGRVIALDIQQKMLTRLEKRAHRAGLASRVEARLIQAVSMGVEDLAGQVDFALAFALVHEVPDARRFFREVAETLKPGTRCLVAEPSGRVPEADFDATLAAAESAGLRVESRPAIAGCRSVLLVKG